MTRTSVDSGPSSSVAERSTGRPLGAVTHQTAMLSKGKHSSPEHGACVMELASMLAGEPFSDRPASVCPVIGSFLRAYNDVVDDERRQDLYAYASKVVDSRASEEVQRARAQRMAAWTAEHPRWWTRVFHLPARRRSPLQLEQAVDALGTHAIGAISRPTDQTHARALALIDELLALDVGETAPARHGADTAYDGAVARQSPTSSLGRTRPCWEQASIRLIRARHSVT